MIALDASALIAYQDSHDAHHASAVALIQGTAEPLVAHQMTWAEVLVGGVMVGRGRQMRQEIHAMGVDLHLGDVDEPLRLAELRVSTGLRLPDCCVLDVALVQGAALATFDARLATAARSRDLTVLA